jgi:hypothetical protein
MMIEGGLQRVIHKRAFSMVGTPSHFQWERAKIVFSAM